MGFVFKWLASSAIIYYFSNSVGTSVLGGFIIAIVDSLTSGKEVVVVHH